MLAWNTRWENGSFVFNIADLIVVMMSIELLTNVRYADDRLLYARSDTDRATMVECLVEELAAAG